VPSAGTRHGSAQVRSTRSSNYADGRYGTSPSKTLRFAVAATDERRTDEEGRRFKTGAGIVNRDRFDQNWQDGRRFT